jgi:hypothetical protein
MLHFVVGGALPRWPACSCSAGLSLIYSAAWQANLPAHTAGQPSCGVSIRVFSHEALPLEQSGTYLDLFHPPLESH